MKFKAKLRKIGNSIGVITPKEIITGYNVGDVITLEVITEVITPVITQGVITPEKEENPIKGFMEKRAKKKHKRLVFNLKKGINEWL